MPVLVPGFQWSDCSNSSIHLRYVKTVSKSRGLSTDVLHSWWKTPPPPLNTPAVVGNLNQRSISVGFVIVLSFFPKSPIGSVGFWNAGFLFPEGAWPVTLPSGRGWGLDSINHNQSHTYSPTVKPRTTSPASLPLRGVIDSKISR